MNRRSGNKKNFRNVISEKKPLKIKRIKVRSKGIKKGKEGSQHSICSYNLSLFRTWFLPISISERMQETEEDLRVVDRGLGICAMAQDL